MSKGSHCNKRRSWRRHNTGKCTGHTVVCNLEPILLLANLGRKFKAFGSNIIITLLLEVVKCGYFIRNV